MPKVTIYRVQPDVNNYQYFLLEENNLVSAEMLDFDGTPKGAKWIAPSVYVLKPNLRQGNFPDLWSTASIVVDEMASEKLCGLLERSGELLPLSYQDKMYYVLNVTECINILDERDTQWLYEKGSLPIQRYAFHASRLTSTPLFKIPETCRYEILTCEGLNDPYHEFKGRVEQLGLKGLLFEKLWSSES